MPEIQITLNQIKEKNPCDDYDILVDHLGSDFPVDKPFNVSIILEIDGFEYNAVSNALWVSRCLPEYSRMWRLFSVWCAREVERLMADERSIAALNVAERFANGEATEEELHAARRAAYAVDATTYAAAAYAATYAVDATTYAAAAYAADSAAAADADRENQKEKLLQILKAGEWVES